jgi:hypothetical protein
MKDGRTHLAHKAEHMVDLETGAIVAVTVQTMDGGDSASSKATLEEALDVIADVMEDQGHANLWTLPIVEVAVTQEGLRALADRHRLLHPD